MINERPKGARSRDVCAICIAVFFLALCVRLWGIADKPLQADEIHWPSRSREVVKHLKAGRYDKATTHLGQPGVAPALAMGAGQVIGSRWNGFLGKEVGDSGYVDLLTASRVTNAFVSSLIAPVIFLGAASLLGFWAALLASVLIALDPHHVGLSQMAHLDSMLTLFVSAALFLYASSVIKRKTSLKMLSGVFWGLAIATKPTAGSLVLAFIAFKLLLGVFRRLGGERWERSIVWSDFWAVLLGHAVFSLLYTRLWFHNSDYRRRLRIHSSIADAFYDSGEFLQNNLWVASVLLFAVMALGCFLYRHWLSKGRKRGVVYQGLMLCALGATFVVILTAVPQVLENIARYWTWASGLADDKHVSYGHVWSPPAYGYIGMFLSELPSMSIIGFLIGTCIIFSLFWKKEGQELRGFFVLLLLSVVIWSAVLGVSDKQTLRYVMPIVPAFYVVVSFGLTGVLRVLRISSGLVVLILASIIQAGVLFFAAPEYHLFFNNLSGGLSGARERGHTLAFSGHNEAIKFLHELSIKKDKGFKIGAFGGIEVLERSYDRLYGKKASRLRFEPDPSSFSHEYVVIFGSFYKYSLMQSLLSPPANGKVIFSHNQDGVVLLAVLEFPVPKYDEPLELGVGDASRKTGKKERYLGTKPQRNANGKKVITAKPGRDSKGYMMFGKLVRVEKGDYQARFDLGLPSDVPVKPEFGKERYVVRLELGSKCSRIVVLGELSSEELREIDVECSYNGEAIVHLRAYWFGNIPLVISDLGFGRAEGSKE